MSSFQESKNEQFTPLLWLNLVRGTLGEIKWDLASCDSANERVGATHYFSSDYSFLENHHDHDWWDRFYCNPPYSSGLVDQWVNIICGEPRAKGVLLTNTSSCAGWYQTALNASTWFFMPSKRINFTDGSTGKVRTGNRYDQTFFFFNCHPHYFRKLGTISTTVRLNELLWMDSHESIVVAPDSSSSATRPVA